MSGGPGDLASLLASGEHAAFHGKPAAAVGVLEQAVVLAQSQARSAEMAAAAWLLGVALGAGGRYGAALTVLSPLVESGRAPGSPPEHRLFAALSSATIASVHRQLGRHAVARDADVAALDLTDGTGEAAFDAQLGLAADAVGLEDLDEAIERATLAERLIPERADEWWRQRVRLGWVQADIALLEGRAAEAAEVAAAAVDRAENARAPRHVAKGLLYLGLAQLSGDDADAVQTLRRAATLAESLGTIPLIWPARALLGALLADDDQGESDRSLAAARSAVLTIAGDLPPGVRSEWLARPDIAALLGG
jgi:tetratricopeptide (TPR) repeat protein